MISHGSQVEHVVAMALTAPGDVIELASDTEEELAKLRQAFADKYGVSPSRVVMLFSDEPPKSSRRGRALRRDHDALLPTVRLRLHDANPSSRVAFCVRARTALRSALTRRPCRQSRI
jgi:hypothetical protein